MKSRICSIVSLAVVALLGASGPLRAEAEAKWKVMQMDGGDYISFTQIEAFYQFKSVQQDSKPKIALEDQRVRMTFESGSTDCVINGIRFLLSKPVVEKDGHAYLFREDLGELIDPAIRPAGIHAAKFDTVVLDAPRFGDHDGPANINEPAGRIAELVGKKLEGSGFKVVMRSSGNAETTDLPGEGAIYLRISFSLQKEKSGGLATTVGADSGASVALAAAVHDMVVRKLGRNTVDAGIRRDPALLLPMTGQPSIVFEPGNLSNPKEAALVNDERYQRAVADGIVQGISRYRTAISGIPRSMKADD